MQSLVQNTLITGNERRLLKLNEYRRGQETYAQRDESNLPARFLMTQLCYSAMLVMTSLCHDSLLNEVTSAFSLPALRPLAPAEKLMMPPADRIKKCIQVMSLQSKPRLLMTC